MTPIEPALLEQLCAWMDGELPADEARFLERRLQNEPALRAQFERWQLASACLRGQPVRLMPLAVSAGITQAMDAAGTPARRARWPWVASAAAAILVAWMLPQGPAVGPMQDGLDDPPALASAAPTQPGPANTGEPGTVVSTDPAAPATPVLPVSEFPLARGSTPKPWPRSPLGPDAAAMQDYLVRHNALMAEDGLAGFMPYVDVVAHGAQALSPAPEEDGPER